MNSLQNRAKGSSSTENVISRAPLQDNVQMAAHGARAQSEPETGSPKSGSSGDSEAREGARLPSERESTAGRVFTSVLTADRLARAAQGIMQVRRVSKQWSKEVGRVVGELSEQSSQALENADQRLGVRDWAEKKGIMAQAQAMNTKFGEVSQAVNDKFGEVTASWELPSGLSNRFNPSQKEQFWNTLNKMVVNKISSLGPPRKLMAALDPSGLCFVDVVKYPGAKGLVALTIDDAPCHVPDTDECLLEEVGILLNQYSAKATFFLCTDFVAGHEEALITLLQNGHEVANHGGADRSYSGESEECFEQQFVESERICDDLRRRAGVTRGGRRALTSEESVSTTTTTIRIAPPVYVRPRPSPVSSMQSSRHPSMATMVTTPVASPLTSPKIRRSPDSELQEYPPTSVRKASLQTSPVGPYPARGASASSSSSATIVKVPPSGGLSADTTASSVGPAPGRVTTTVTPKGLRLAPAPNLAAPNNNTSTASSSSIAGSDANAASAAPAPIASTPTGTAAATATPATAPIAPSLAQAPSPPPAPPSAPAPQQQSTRTSTSTPALAPAPVHPAATATASVTTPSSTAFSSIAASAASTAAPRPPPGGGGPTTQIRVQNNQIKMVPVKSAPSQMTPSSSQMTGVRTAPSHTQDASKILTDLQVKAFLGSRPVAKEDSDTEAEDENPRWVRHGSRHKWFRAPHADCSPAMHEVLRKHGFTNVLCDSFANDTIITDASFIAETLTELIDPQGGSIVVIHTPERSFRQHNLEAIQIFLEKMQEQQLRVVSVSELVDAALSTPASTD